MALLTLSCAARLSPGRAELAAQYVVKGSPEFGTPSRVLAATRAMVAMEICCEPHVRSLLRWGPA